MRIIELFAGIGSQTQALKNIGVEHEVVGISEICPIAIKSYNTLHGETYNFGDITKIEKLPNVNLWTYSFPCTNISTSGKQEGFKKGSGTTSGLLWEVERLLNISEKPEYLLMENVKNLISKKFTNGFEDWISILDNLGYNSYWKTLNASNYGIPQERERVFMISIRKDLNRVFTFPKEKELKLFVKDFVQNIPHKVNNTLLPYYEDKWHKNYSKTSKGIIKLFDGEKQDVFKSDFTNKRIYSIEGTCPTITRNNSINFKELGGYLNGDECLLLTGFTQEQVDKLDFLSSRQKQSLAGNCIVVQVLEEIFLELFKK